MSNWNPNVTGIPGGSMVTRTIKTKDGVRHYDEHQPDFVILASKCGKVIKSYWIKDEQRFAGFKKGELPIAWMHWPSFPSHLLGDLPTKETTERKHARERA